MNILAIGEILWDVADGEERLGGGALNFGAQCARLGERAAIVSAVGDDERGRRALKKARELNIDLRWVRTTDKYATGYVSVTLKAGQPEFVIHRPAAYDDARLDRDDLDGILEFKPDWLYFGTLAQTAAGELPLDTLQRELPHVPRFYDINLRKNSYSRELLQTLLPLADVLKINEDEVREVSRLLGVGTPNIATFCSEAANRFELSTICVTRGAAGCSVQHGGRLREFGGYRVETADAVGAGDAFAAAFLHGVGKGWPIGKTADFANRVGAVIASKVGGAPEWSPDEAWALVRTGVR